MTAAYLLLGQERFVLDYFDFVRASQRQDGIMKAATEVAVWVKEKNSPQKTVKHD